MNPESTPTWLIGPEIPPTERIGTVLSGSYRLDAFLGQGMTGVTYNAWHLRQKQPYAVKLLHRELQPSHERVSRLRQDLRTLSGLRRTGFLPVELSFAPDGAPFLASELLTGETLRSRLLRGPLPVLATGIVTAALARALGEAHQQAIVHGDLRPENVLLPSEAGREVEAGQPVLLDAALHHLRRRPIGLDESLPLGKLVYLAPEQASGEQLTANVAGDIFALGAILYECLTGQQAFAAAELEVVLEKLAAPPAKLVLPREVGAPPGLAEALDEVIARACARDPEERYQTMAELLAGLDKAFAQCGLPLPPPDERVPIDTVKAQNRELRKRTVAVKKVVPLGPMEELPETSGVMSAAAFAHLNALMSTATPEPAESPAVSAKAEPTKPATDKAAASRPITAKHRVVRRTVRARDLSRLLTEVESGRLDAEQALALAAKDDAEPDADDAVPEPVSDAKSEAQRIIEEGRAAVIARAETAKKNRESDTKERQQREQVAAQEMQRRLLEQARQETLGRMRAEWEQSRPLRAKDVAADPRAALRPAGKADPQQAELLAEAQRQAQRLEAEHTEAERGAAEEAAKARTEAAAAEAGRKKSTQLNAELAAAERREAERAEAVRQKAELEATARRLADEAERARALKQAEAATRHQEAEAAQKAAAAKQEEAAKAKQAVDADTEAALWEDGFDLVVDEAKPDHTIPPPIPVAALRARTEAARRAEAEAQQAAAEAQQAAAAAAAALSDAAELEQLLLAARRAQEEAATARVREAAEFAEAVEAAEDVRAQDQALFRQVMEAEKRAKTAEAARIANLDRMSRVTQALHVIRQVQNLAEDAPPGDLASATTPTTAPTSSADTGKFRRPAAPPTGERADAAAPTGPLSSEITGPTGLSHPRVNKAPELVGSPLRIATSQHATRQDLSASYTASQLAAAVLRSAVPDVPQSTQSPGQTGSRTDLSTRHVVAPPPGARSDGSAAYSAAQLAAAGVRADPSAGYTAAQLAAANLRAEGSAGHPPQAAPAGGRPEPSAGYSTATPAAGGARSDGSAAYPAAQLAAAGGHPDAGGGHTGVPLAAVTTREASGRHTGAPPAPAGGRPEPSAGYPAGQLAAGVRPDLSAAYSAAQLAAAGVRPDLSAGYSAAQLAAAGIHPLGQAMPSLSSQAVPSGLHPLAGTHPGMGGRADGDVSALLSAGGVPALLPTGMVPMLPGAMTTAPHPQEASGITLTIRQLVATLTMTSLLSGVIGALIALLVLQRVHPPGESVLVTTGPGSAGVEATAPGTPPVRPSPTAEIVVKPAHPVVPAVAPVPAAGAPGVPAVATPVGGLLDTLVLHRGGAALPPVRLTTVAPIGPPRQSQWVRPAGAAALARPPLTPTPGTKPPTPEPADTEVPAKKPDPETPPLAAKKPAAETPPPPAKKPAETPPPTETKPAPGPAPAPKPPVPAKPASKPASAVQNGLRDPFAH